MKKNKARLFIKTAPKPKELKLHKASRIRRSQAIWKFLESRPAIKIKPLAVQAEYDPANLNKYRLGKKTIPQDLLLKLETILVEYGLSVY